MPDTDDTDPLARLPRRMIGGDNDYAVVLSGTAMREIAREIVEQRVSKFPTEADIIRLIDQRSATRWHNVGLTVSPDASSPGEHETSLRAIFDWNKAEFKRWQESKGQGFRIALAVGQIATALIVVVGGLWGFFTLVMAHIK